jgi:hypothetical protein
MFRRPERKKGHAIATLFGLMDLRGLQFMMLLDLYSLISGDKSNRCRFL